MIKEIFGSMVFNESVMMERLPHTAYKALKETIQHGAELDRSVAEIVANAMKDWAIEKGATHFTHWFQPMTGVTAEKHEAFITPLNDYDVIMEFSGKELIKGEPDASSFPSGGLRATFEARGYTAWDPTSYAFIKENTLYIPTAFCSYTGETLDKKTPLLRSMERINEQSLRILRLFSRSDVTRVIPTAGAEQEYFLIDGKMYDKRPDLKLAGRTLFGARAAKGQELGDQYYGAIKTRVKEFMRELDVELWKLGIFARTEHNEAAPGQHELAPIYTNVNIASDHNQLTMELLKKLAPKHGLTCLLAEKPFEGVNGSGKHNNWSLSTDTGENLLDPGKYPAENLQFLMFFAAIIKAVDVHQDLLRITVASAGNDHRLGGHEAPPAIVSMFIGEELMSILDAIEKNENYGRGKKVYMETGLHSIPRFRKDTTDRNRTSPFAFTGNKFEFRMVGSTMSIADPNIMLNTMVADILSEFADELEPAENFLEAAGKLIARTIAEHKRIIFNGNNYSHEWVEEAERRGLLNYTSAAEAIPHLSDAKNVSLFERYGIFTAAELISRRDIGLENYSMIIHIEALTMLDMARRDILPAISEFTSKLSEAALLKQNIKVDASYELSLAGKLSDMLKKLSDITEKLDHDINASPTEGVEAMAVYARDVLKADMAELRQLTDCAELLVSKKYWPYPGYGEMLFSV